MIGIFMIYRIFLTSITIICIISTTTYADSTSKRISALEKQLKELRQTYMRNNGDMASAIAHSKSVKTDISQIQGKLDSNRHLRQKQQNQLIQMITELDHRIQSIEDRMSVFSTQLSKAISKISPDIADEGSLYQRGLDLASSAKYLEGIAVFKKFIKKYPDGEFTASAQAWIGECYFSARDYQNAIKTYQAFIQKHPKDKHISTALLKQAHSFLALGMHDDAKIFYKKILKEYPRSTAASIAMNKMDAIELEQNRNRPQSSSHSYPEQTMQQKQHKTNTSTSPSTDF